MKVLLTGASSFTGFWFARSLAAGGDRVTAALPRAADAYEGIRLRRVGQLAGIAERNFERPFGSPGFIDLVRRGGPWDALCLHGARVTGYREPDFDWRGAVQENCLNMAGVFEAFAAQGGRTIVTTGTIFEADEGEGDPGESLEAFSPYGLSKTLTWQAVRFEARRRGLTTAKVVLPNPFGPWEEPRFTAYLASTWLAGGTATVKTPAYVRDNIHSTLLAEAYASTVRCAHAAPRGSLLRANPSGYVETMGAFTERFAREIGPRLGVPCRYSLAEQSDFPEPRKRVNTQPATELAAGWNETRAWDELASWYREYLGPAPGPV